MQNQNQSWLGRTRFPTLGAGYVYLLWVLIGSLCCLRLLWLVIVILLLWFWFHDTQLKTTLLAKIAIEDSCTSYLSGMATTVLQRFVTVKSWSSLSSTLPLTPLGPARPVTMLEYGSFKPELLVIILKVNKRKIIIQLELLCGAVMWSWNKKCRSK